MRGRWLAVGFFGAMLVRCAAARPAVEPREAPRVVSAAPVASAAPSAPAPSAAGPAVEPLEAQGLRWFQHLACVTCHNVDGPARVGPSLRGLWGSTVTLASGATVRVEGDAGEAYLLRSLEEPAAEVVASFPPVMPSYRGRLSAAQRAALVAYLRSL